MKKIGIIFLMGMLSFSLGTFAQIKVDANGNVGINQPNPTSRFEVQGSVRFGNWGSGSTWEQVILDYNNPYGAPTLYCNTSGNFNIGKATNKVFNIFVGNIYGDGFSFTSDETVKENIKPLGSTLSRLMGVTGYSYNFKEEYINNLSKRSDNYSKTDFGFIAQNLEKSFPELVNKPDSVNPTYSVNYMGMIPVLLEAIKEQQVQIDELKRLINK